MVTLTAGSVVLVRFPFSDLSQLKLRPAIVLADAGRGDWILCQVTSNPYGDPQATEIDNDDFATGSLQRRSYVRVGKLFTGNNTLVTAQVGTLKPERFEQIIDSVVEILRSGMQ